MGIPHTFRHMVTVDVKLRDGTEMSETVESPKGSEHSFADADTVVGKFRKLVSRRKSIGCQKGASPAVGSSSHQMTGACGGAAIHRGRPQRRSMFARNSG